MTIPRFHVPAVRPGTLDLPESARIHAIRVLRLERGDGLRVFDAGSEFAATIVAIEKHRVVIEVGGPLVPGPERTVPLHLIMSPLKGDLTELVIQKATELGVDRISPVVFERTDTVARREPTEARRERWHRVAASASEQSGRSVVPRIDAVTGLEDSMTALGPAGEGERRIVATQPSVDAERVETASASEVQLVRVAVGPAGGLSPADLERLTLAGFSAERFALHTLRSETACIAAIAILGDRFQ